MLHCGKFQFDLARPLVMGIVNITPDSFSDGGQHATTAAAIAHAQRLIADGADILDIGGESTRPGAAMVSEQEELDRVLPVIEGLRGTAIPISIDTWKPQVMRAALAAGASMVNDVNALQEPGALQAVAGNDAAVCLMHKQGTPQTMQQHPEYRDVIAEVSASSARRWRIISTCCASWLHSAPLAFRYWRACRASPCWGRSPVEMSASGWPRVRRRRCWRYSAVQPSYGCMMCARRWMC